MVKLIFGLFIHSLLSCFGYRALNYGIFLNKLGRNQSWLILRHYSNILLKELRKSQVVSFRIVSSLAEIRRRICRIQSRGFNHYIIMFA